MPHNLGRTEFFVREAGEYLNRLEPLLAQANHGQDESFVQLARAIRGAAMMAGPPGLARAAASLEGIAKSLRNQTRHWTPELSEALRSAHRQFERLVTRAKDWGPDEREEAARLTQELDRVLGSPASIHPRGGGAAPADGPPTPGLLSFVRHEAARIASTLRELAGDAGHPADHDLRTVLEQMHTLRGLAPHQSLTALHWVLEGLESLINDLLRGYPPPRSLPAVLGQAAKALLSAATDLLDGPDAVPKDVEEFGLTLYEGFAREADVVPIEPLLLSTEVTVPEIPEPRIDPMDLVSLGDRLRHSASLLRDGSADARRFHLYALAATLRSVLPPNPQAELAAATRRILGSIQSGAALDRPDAMAQALLSMAEPLNEAPRTTLEDVFRDLGRASDLLPAASTQPVAPTAAVSTEEVPIVPIEELLLTPVPQPVPFPEAAGAPRTVFERSFSRLHQLESGRGVPAPDEGVVSIDTLLYRGNAARARLEALCRSLREMGHAGVPSALPLLDELADLIPLALDNA